MNEYNAISSYYGDKVAKRSNVKLMNHIDEGIKILNYIGSTENAKRAFCLHPIFQMDDALVVEGRQYIIEYGITDAVILALEYRSIANSYLAKHSFQEIRLSNLKEVNDMLIADKVQNKKDFDIYHKGIHPNSDRLIEYFDQWLSVLGVNNEMYKEILKND